LAADSTEFPDNRRPLEFRILIFYALMIIELR